MTTNYEISYFGFNFHRKSTYYIKSTLNCISENVIQLPLRILPWSRCFCWILNIGIEFPIPIFREIILLRLIRYLDSVKKRSFYKMFRLWQLKIFNINSTLRNLKLLTWRNILYKYVIDKYRVSLQVHLESRSYFHRAGVFKLWGGFPIEI